MITKILPVLAVVLTASQAVRLTTRVPTTTPPPSVTLTVVSIPSSTRTEPPPPPVACPDAARMDNPLARLRAAMKNVSYTQMNAFFDAFLVFYSDEHLSEDPAADERRLEYISGWDGPGTGVVLADGEAALWVSAGDVPRARATVSCAWLVLNSDDTSHPTIAEWIAAPERLGRKQMTSRVGADARLTSWQEWQGLSAAIQGHGLQLIHSPTLLDQLWAEEPEPWLRRPYPSRIVANLHNVDYTGLTWIDKVSLLRYEIRQNEAESMIVTALDEVSWLLNVRGRDLPYAPLLKAFVIVTMKDVRVYVPPGKVAMPVREVLSAVNCFHTNNCTRVIDYTLIYTDLRQITESKVLIPSGGTFQRGASAAIAQSVPRAKRVFAMSPIIYLKAQKNDAEIKGMKRAHLRDAVAMCTLLSYMEGAVKHKGLSELTVASTADTTRATQAGYVGLSLRTRTAFGPSGADPEYRATNRTDRRVYTNSTLIIHSGGQYDEGTTVVTRTLHYGIPTKEMRTAYTTVLRSLAALSTLQIPSTLPAAHTDPVARAPLWAAKQDFTHPTGYGVGAAMNRREDPVVIDYKQDANLHMLKPGYFITIEPAWYEMNKFGVRLGNVVEVVNKSAGYLAFREATLLPFEPKLIDKSQLTEYEITWLNEYNKRIRMFVGPELRDLGLFNEYYWMSNKTEPIMLPSKMAQRSTSNANSHRVTFIAILASVLVYL